MSNYPAPQTPPPALSQLLKPYKNLLGILVVLALLSNALTLLLPKLIAHGVDSFVKQTLEISTIGWIFALVSLLIFTFTYLQSIVQTYASERVARDLRAQLAAKISTQTYAYVQQTTPAKLLTNITSDIDSIKLFVSQAIVSLVSSVCIIIGASILLLLIDWKLALAVLTIIPIIGGTFFIIFGKVKQLFLKTREVIDWLNKVINESILGSALIRALHSQKEEETKFIAANTQAKDIGLQILKLFATLIPIITFVAGSASIIILALGGHFVITNEMSLGDFAAFNSYLGLLIFPILVIGFVSNVIAQATASYGRIASVLHAQTKPDTGTLQTTLRGQIDIKDVSVIYGEKPALKHVSLSIPAGSKTAIIGPTAAGKSQLLYLLTALTEPTSGVIEFDGQNIQAYNKKSLHNQIGFVFQDSILFHLSVRENIAFNNKVSEVDLQKAIDTAELTDFINQLPQKLDTRVSERGTNLSGGQKQRLMLARALALNPRILLLDDFTARVDTNTERKILGNVRKNYPNLTLVSVTQKIASVEDYDQIVLLMEGEVLAHGTHPELLKACPEYVQIYQSQQSTHQYELSSQ